MSVVLPFDEDLLAAIREYGGEEYLAIRRSDDICEVDLPFATEVAQRIRDDLRTSGDADALDERLSLYAWCRLEVQRQAVDIAKVETEVLHRINTLFSLRFNRSELTDYLVVSDASGDTGGVGQVDMPPAG